MSKRKSKKQEIDPRRDYSTAEVAKLLGISPGGARRYFREGRIGRETTQRGQKVFLATGQEVLDLVAQGDQRLSQEARHPRVLGRSLVAERIPRADKAKPGKQYWHVSRGVKVRVVEWKKKGRGWVAIVCPVGERGRVPPYEVFVSELSKAPPASAGVA